jgi:hypothetical protein
MFDAFGDESCGDRFVTYGVLVVPQAEKAPAEAILAQVKNDFSGQADSKLHCRTLFAGSARTRSSWAHLAMADVFRLYEELVMRLKDISQRRIVTVARLADFPVRLPAAPMQHVGSKPVLRESPAPILVPHPPTPPEVGAVIISGHYGAKQARQFLIAERHSSSTPSERFNPCT